MDESTFETFEDELGQPPRDVSPSKPLRTARTGGRGEMYTQRRTREEAPALHQVPKMTPREHPVSSATSFRKSLSIQNLAQIETPWEGVTLNRCLIVAITILVLTCGLQRINEALRGRKDVGEEITAVSERHTFIRRTKLPTHEPETSFWDTFFWWLADEDDDGEGKRKSKRASQGRASRGFRHRTIPNLRLLKKRETQFSERRGRRDEGEMKERMKGTREKEIKVRKKITEEEEEVEMMEKTKKPVEDSKQKPKKQ